MQGRIFLFVILGLTLTFADWKPNWQQPGHDGSLRYASPYGASLDESGKTFGNNWETTFGQSNNWNNYQLLDGPIVIDARDNIYTVSPNLTTILVVDGQGFLITQIKLVYLEEPIAITSIPQMFVVESENSSSTWLYFVAQNNIYTINVTDLNDTSIVYVFDLGGTVDSIIMNNFGHLIIATTNTTSSSSYLWDAYGKTATALLAKLPYTFGAMVMNFDNVLYYYAGGYLMTIQTGIFQYELLANISIGHNADIKSLVFADNDILVGYGSETGYLDFLIALNTTTNMTSEVIIYNQTFQSPQTLYTPIQLGYSSHNKMAVILFSYNNAPLCIAGYNLYNGSLMWQIEHEENDTFSSFIIDGNGDVIFTAYAATHNGTLNSTVFAMSSSDASTNYHQAFVADDGTYVYPASDMAIDYNGNLFFLAYNITSVRLYQWGLDSISPPGPEPDNHDKHHGLTGLQIGLIIGGSILGLILIIAIIVVIRRRSVTAEAKYEPIRG